MQRILVTKLAEHVGERATVMGWLHRRRELGRITFLVVRDRSGFGQVVITDSAQAERASSLHAETALAVTGEVVGSPQAPGVLRSITLRLKSSVPRRSRPRSSSGGRASPPRSRSSSISRHWRSAIRSGEPPSSWRPRLSRAFAPCWSDSGSPKSRRRRSSHRRPRAEPTYSGSTTSVVPRSWPRVPSSTSRQWFSNGFDLLFRGLELITGGQRLHRYEDYLAALEAHGQRVSDYESYLQAFKYGMPPHGGFAIGLERWTARLTGAANIREVTLFPRDMHRLTP